MTTETTTEKPAATDKKRKRLTLEEQIARQEELLAKEKESLAKKQQRLRSLNASKMNKDRKEAQKKRNAMLIQLGLFFIEHLNRSARSEREDYIDVTEEIIQFHINDVESIISDEEEYFNSKFVDNNNTNEAKIARKYITDKNILLEALNNLKENYFKYGEAKIKL